MIAVTELRIGNWVSNYTGKPIQVESIREYGINIFEDELQFPLGQLQPIPLTPEILEKCGMEQVAMNRVEQVGTGAYLECAYELKYLHQIQNLHFILLGKELEISL